ncbi:MAG TPA: hypothetical protein VFO25_04495 [Candidatus Eremiobacteraceae bacterium]|nr:hypothetical protein [Candidatus Eremiobacteraceae bacterium]
MGPFLADAFDRAVTATIENWKIGIIACLVVASVRLLDDSTRYHLASLGVALLSAAPAVVVAGRAIGNRAPAAAGSVIRFLWSYLAWSVMFFASLIMFFVVFAGGVILAALSHGAAGQADFTSLPATVFGAVLAFVAVLATTALLSRLLLAQFAGFVEGLGVRAAFRRALVLTRGLYWRNLAVVLVTVVATALPDLIAFGIAILTFRIFGSPWTEATDQSHIRLAATIALPARWYGIVAFFVAMLRYYERLRARHAEVTTGA